MFGKLFRPSGLRRTTWCQEILFKLDSTLLCPGGEAEGPPLSPGAWGLLLSSGTGSDAVLPAAGGSSSSSAFLDPCFRGRVLVGGILFPLNKNRIKASIRVVST